MLLILQKQIIRKETKCVLHNNKTNWPLFQDIIESTINNRIRLKTEKDIATAVEHFNTCIQNAAWESTPLTNVKDQVLSFLESVINKVAEKRKLRKEWQKSRCLKLKTRLNYVIRDLKQSLDKIKNKDIQTNLQNLDAKTETDYSLWKVTRGLKQPQVTSPSLRRPNGTWARNDSENAATFAEHLS